MFQGMQKIVRSNKMLLNQQVEKQVFDGALKHVDKLEFVGQLWRRDKRIIKDNMSMTWMYVSDANHLEVPINQNNNDYPIGEMYKNKTSSTDFFVSYVMLVDPKHKNIYDRPTLTKDILQERIDIIATTCNKAQGKLSILIPVNDVKAAHFLTIACQYDFGERKFSDIKIYDSSAGGQRNKIKHFFNGFNKEIREAFDCKSKDIKSVLTNDQPFYDDTNCGNWATCYCLMHMLEKKIARSANIPNLILDGFLLLIAGLVACCVAGGGLAALFVFANPLTLLGEAMVLAWVVFGITVVCGVVGACALLGGVVLSALAVLAITCNEVKQITFDKAHNVQANLQVALPVPVPVPVQEVGRLEETDIPKLV